MWALKKQTVGNSHNPGRQWLPGKQPKTVQGHDVPDPELPRAYPHCVYDIGRHAGSINVGTDHERGEFAVASIGGGARRADTCMRKQRRL